MLRDKGRCAVKIAVPECEGMRIEVREGLPPGGPAAAEHGDREYLLGEGIYNVSFEAEGFCPQEIVTVIHAEDTGGRRTIDIEPVRIYGKNAEFRGPMYVMPEGYEKNMYGDPEGYAPPQDLFRTPGFDPGKKGGCFTEASERASFLERICGESTCCRYFRYSSLPVAAIGRDLDPEADLLSTAEQMRNSGKLNIMYQAQIHGTEPFSGEAALMLLGQLAKGRDGDILDKVNIIAVPCCNTAGAEQFTRDNNGINMNRDCLALRCGETVHLHRLFRRLLPEAVIDAHSFTRANGIRSPLVTRSALDIRISPAGSFNVDEDIKRISRDITDRALEELSGYGLRSGYYSDSADPSSSRVFYGLHGCCSFLAECEGTRSGRMHLKRNVLSSFLGVRTLMRLLADNSAAVKQASERARKRLLTVRGDFTLKHGKSGNSFLKTAQPSYDLEGNITDPDYEIRFPEYDQKLRSRSRPGEYIIPADLENIDEILQELERHEIVYTITGQPAAVDVCGYIKDEDGYWKVSEPECRTFAGGIVTVPSLQISSAVICSLLEPDTEDASPESGSMTQRGILRNDRDTFSVFRYTDGHKKILSEKRSL